MGSEEFAQAVRGSGGQAISTTAAAAFEVDNYQNGAKLQGTAYPLSADPAFTIQHVAIFQLPADKTLDLVTSNGTTISGLEPAGATAYLDGLELDSITVNDPDATAGDTAILLIGE